MSVREHRVTVPMVARMEALWDAGLSYAAVAAVVSLDRGVVVTANSVRYYLQPHVAKRGIRMRGKGGSGMRHANLETSF